MPPDPAAYLAAVEPVLRRGVQVVFGNLEGTLTTSVTSKCGARSHLGCFAFRDPPGNFAGYGNFSTGGDLAVSVILRVTLSSQGQFKAARIYPVQLTREGRPLPGGGAIALAARLAREDFGSSAARILPSGVIKAP